MAYNELKSATHCTKRLLDKIMHFFFFGSDWITLCFSSRSQEMRTAQRNEKCNWNMCPLRIITVRRNNFGYFYLIQNPLAFEMVKNKLKFEKERD